VAEFTCQNCGVSFTLSDEVLARYEGWTPRWCRECKPASGRSTGTAKPRRKKTANGPMMTVAEVIERYTEGPDCGVFTDGGSVPNPGPGGWGAVYVVKGEVIDRAYGHDPDTTNNRMEFTAFTNGIGLVPAGTEATVYCDSKLVVQTVTEWAAGWEQRGWKRRTGPIKNLDLVKPAYFGLRNRPELRVEWLAAHAGYLWNEYADALSTAWRRDEL
jgi:ribonuclease HI